MNFNKKPKNNIKDEYLIIDKREEKEFNNISFSKFKKTDVKKQLIKSVTNNKIEDSMYWSSELICSGHFLDLWEIIFEIMSKYIYLANPKLPIYIQTKIQTFKNILIPSYLNNELNLRNNIKIRELFSEIFVILTYSRKKQKYDYIKIDKNEFNINELSFRLKADNLQYSNNCFKNDDPKELIIATNELCFNLTNKNTLQACYWIEWILQFEKNCKKKKEKCICNTRNFNDIDNIKDNTDVIWLIWECIIYYSKMTNPITIKSINSLLKIFNLHYSTSIKTKRKHIIYYAIYLITEDYNIKLPICNTNSQIINNIVNNINNIYKIIKKNEIIPEQNYLFTSVF
jgi:hypothetical protein